MGDPVPAVADGTAAVVLGCAGLTLSDDERRFFRESRPAGFILFARNCETPDQVRALVDALRETVGDADAPVLIDQEGGRVARLKPPHWRAAPPAAAFGDVLRRAGPEVAVEAARINARLIGAELRALGITVDCAPVLDIPAPDGHDIVGDRAYGADPDTVALLGRATADGLLDAGVAPVIKHLPGHGRARADSHLALPVVDAARAELEAVDFPPFRDLADLPCAMTAHVLYSALDPQSPATTSREIISGVIRGWIGFEGLLISDDLSMKALEGRMRDRAESAVTAGCDIALHCNGDPREMAQVVEGSGPLGAAAARRMERLRAVTQSSDGAVDMDATAAGALKDRLAELLRVS